MKKMYQIVENQTRIAAEFLAHSHASQMSLDECLRESSIKFLLERVDFDEDQIIASIEASRATLKNVRDSLPAGALKDHLQELEEEIPEQGEISGAIIEDDKNKLQNLSTRIITSTENANKFAATLATAFVKIGKQFEKFVGKLNDDEKSESLVVLAKKASDAPNEWRSKFVTLEQLKSGLNKAFVPPGWYDKAKNAGLKAAKVSNSWFGKIVNFLKGAKKGITEMSPETVADSVLNTTFSDFMKSAKKMELIVLRLEDVVSKTSAAGAEVSATASGQAPDENSKAASTETRSSDVERGAESDDSVDVDDTSEKIAKSLGATPIPKKNLTALLKNPAFADVTGKGAKATRARKALRLAINKAANDTIFEEGLIAGHDRIRREEDKSDDLTMFDRWKNLAGIS